MLLKLKNLDSSQTNYAKDLSSRGGVQGGMPNFYQDAEWALGAELHA